MTADSWRSLRAAGVTTLVDLRNEAERARMASDPDVEASVTAGLDVIAAPTEVPDDPVFRQVCGPWLDHPRSYPDNLRLFPKLASVAFGAIADAKGSVLIHCSGGRDRTGMVTAVLLSLSGVTAEAIAADYARAYRAAAQHSQARSEPAAIAGAVRERTSSLLEWLAEFDAAGYLVNAGMSEESVARLAARLL